jgi:glycosyltransferase involved in cell wall biosynthesis
MTGRPEVCMFLATPLRHDTRVEKEAAALADAGYNVRIIASFRPGLSRVERRAGATIVRVEDDPLPARAARALLRHRTLPATAPGDVITREAVERTGARAWLLRLLLRVHLRLTWRRYLRTALRAAREEPAHLWVAHDLETLPAALRARRRMGGRVLYDSHELFIDSSLARGERRRWERLERRSIGHADAVMTVSGAVARALADRYGIAMPEVVLNAPSAVAGPAPVIDLRHTLSLPDGARIVLYLGGIQQQRGLEQLIAAVAGDHGLVLVMLGPGTDSYRAELVRKAAAAGAGARVRFLPAVPPSEIRSYAQGADVGVATIQDTFLSYRYALPNKLFDYLQAGLPLVVSDFPEMRALVERHDVGTTCDPASPSAIAAAIDRVTLDPVRHAELRAHARAAAELYTWECEREKLLALVAGLR